MISKLNILGLTPKSWILQLSVLWCTLGFLLSVKYLGFGFRNGVFFIEKRGSWGVRYLGKTLVSVFFLRCQADSAGFEMISS